MNAKYFLILLFPSLVVLQGCKELDPDDPYQLTLADFLENNKPALQTFTVQAGVASETECTSGDSFSFGANSFFTLAGNAVSSGSVEIQIREIKNRKDMILSQVPTISDNELIYSDGMYYIKALQDGFELVIKDFTIKKGTYYSTLNLPEVFFGGIDNVSNSFNWFTNDSIGLISVDTTLPQYVDSYNVDIYSTYITQNYNWINCDYFYPDTVPRVALFFPTTDTISVYYFQSYLVFNDLNAVLRYDSYSNTQIEFYNIPTGVDATLVTYYIVDGKAFVATADITVSDALSTPITFTETTEQGLLSILEGL